MAHENAGLDENSKWVMMGVTNDASKFRTMFRVDPSTLRLLVDANISGSVGALDQFDLTTTNPLAVAIVDGNGDQITSIGGGTEYTEDAAAAADPVGKALIGIRADSLAAVTTTDGDNIAARMTNKGELYIKHVDSIPITDNSGSLTVDAPVGTPVYVRLSDGSAAITTLPVSLASVPSHAVTNAGTFAVQVDGAALTALQNIDTDTTTIIGHVDGLEGLLTTIDADTGNIATSVQLIDDTIFVAGTDTYSEATSKGGLILAVRRDADTTLANTTNEFVPLQVDANGYLKVEIFDGGGSHTVDNAGTFAVQDSAAEASLSVMDDWDNGASDGASVSGDVAHDTADVGEPVKIGGKALDVGATPTAVSANDRVNAAFLRNGAQLILGGEPNIITKNLNVSDADGAQTDAALVTVSAGTCIVVTMIQVYLDAATTATGGVQARIGFGTANTPALDAAGVVFSHSGIAAGSGAVVGNGSGIIGIGASNEDLRLTCEDPTGGNLDIIVTYFTMAIG